MTGHGAGGCARYALDEAARLTSHQREFSKFGRAVEAEGQAYGADASVDI